MRERYKDFCKSRVEADILKFKNLEYCVLTGKYKFDIQKGSKQNVAFVEIECICKNKKYIPFCKLKRKEIISCGCIRKKLSTKRQLGKRSYTEYKYFAQYFLKQVKKHLKRGNRTLEFSITIKDLDNIWEKQNGKCYFSGRKLILPDFSLGHNYQKSQYNVSIDRLDPNLGYIKENIVLVDKIINTMKWDLNEEDFISLCKEIVSYKDN